MGNPQDPAAFEAATDAVAAQGSDPIDKICELCKGNWIKIRYEYEDGTGVPGANYVVQAVTADGSPTGDIIAEGKTDANGDAHVPLSDEHTQVEFYFHDDPEGEPYEDPEAAKPLEEPEPGFWRGLWENITDGADWIWGVLKGDFEEDPSTSQIIGRMILTMIPGIDQLADVQDIVNILYRLIWKQEWEVKMHWVLLVITLIGLIPVLGSLAKGLLKLVIKKAGDVSALRALYGVFNYFKKGNAHRWIRDFAADLTGKHLDSALALLDEMMTRVVYYMTEAKTFLGGLTGWNGLINDALAKVAAFRTAAPAKLREAAAYLQKQLVDTLRVGMSRIQRKGTKNHDPHVVKQEKVEPPRRLSGGTSIEVRKAPDRSSLSDERIRELGVNHEQGNVTDLREGVGGARYEQTTGSPLSPSATEGVDFYDGDTPISLKGPLARKDTGEILPFNDSMVDGLADSVIKGAKTNTAARDIVVDTLGLSDAQRSRLTERIAEGLDSFDAMPTNIVILE